MQLSDVTVEVRNGALVRVGQILPTELIFELYPLFNEVGSWKLTLAAEHPMAPVLRTPGAGIIVTGPTDVILSGPVTVPSFATNTDDPAGTVEFVGITDDHVLRDRSSYPTPSTADVTAQTEGHDERTGKAETLLHAYVSANTGPLAPAARKVPTLTMGADLGRGTTMTKKPRFRNLLELLQEIALTDGLGFRVVQRGSVLRFETYQIVDRRATIRLSAETGTLVAQKVSISAPGATRIIVAGQGEQEERTFVEVSNADSLAAETDWGRRIEFFKDQRNTDVHDELVRAGLEQLAEDGFSNIAVQAIANDDTDGTMRLGIDWFLGDKVTVVVEDQEVSSVVTGLALKANSLDGFKVGVMLGDPVGFSYEAAVRKKLSSFDSRLANLELNAEASDTIAGDVEDLQGDLTDVQGDVSTLQTDVTANKTQLAKLPYAEAAGSTVINGSAVASGGFTTTTVTLPVGRFSVAPVVTVALQNAPGGTQMAVPRANAVTTSSFSILIFNVSGAPITWTGASCGWSARQMTPTTAAG